MRFPAFYLYGRSYLPLRTTYRDKDFDRGPVSRNYGYVKTIDELSSLVDKVINEGNPIGFDIETGYLGPPMAGYALHPETAIIAGFSFTNSKTWARYAPVGHDLPVDNLPSKEAAALLWNMLATGLGVAHNAKFELRHLSKWFLSLLSEHPLFGKAVTESEGYFPIRSDTWIEAYLAGEYSATALKPMTEEVFGHKMIEIWELFPDLPKNKRKMLRFNELELTPIVVEYACEDSVWCLAHHERNYPKVQRMFLYEVEMNIIRVLCDMEDYGVLYAWEEIDKKSKEAHPFLDRMREEIKSELSDMMGMDVEEFLSKGSKKPVKLNIQSSAQIQKILYSKLGMSTTRYTKSSQDSSNPKMSTDAIALTGLSKQYPVVRKILDWKSLYKLLSTYLDKYEKEYRRADGKAHPNHMQAVVVTGRFAVADPPYQQTPKGNTEKGYHYELSDGTVFDLNFRDLIVAPKDHYVFGFDVSQMELRVISGESGEPGMLQAFREDIDIHAATAALMLGRPASEVTKDDRKIGKAQPLTETVFTPSGWKNIGDIKVGDYVYSSDGKPTKVTGVFPQGEKTIYKVSFSDKTSTRCCGEHLWNAKDAGDPKRGYRTFCTEFMRSRMRKDHRPTSAWRWSIPITEPVLFPDNGVKSAYEVGRTLAQQHIPEWNMWPGHKWIPTKYKTASMENRIALLQGFLDVRGKPMKRSIMVASNDLTFLEDLGFIVRSLGGTFVTYQNKRNMRSMIKLPLSISPFRDSPLKEQLDLTSPVKKIVAIEEDGVEEAVCISVENETGLYLTRNFIVTHNTMNFALLYGMGMKSLAERLGVEFHEAKALHHRYFETLSVLKLWIERQIETGKRRGFTTSRFGRKHPIWEFASNNPAIYSKGERLCVNAPIQGGAADYMKVAMVRCWKAIQKAGLRDKIKLVLNIHDALEFYVHNSVSPQEVVDLIRPAVLFPVPGWPDMQVEWHVGPSWGDLKILEVQADGKIFLSDTDRSEKIEEEDIETSVSFDETEKASLAEVIEASKRTPVEPPEIHAEPLEEAPRVEIRTGPAKAVLVTLLEMPTEIEWARFRKLAIECQGPNTIKVITPEGEIELNGTSGIGPEDQSLVSMAIPGAEISLSPDSVDHKELMKGMSL